MRGAERSKGYPQFVLRWLDRRSILQCHLNKSASFIFDPFVVGANQSEEITLDLVGNHFQNVGQMLALRRQLDNLLALLSIRDRHADEESVSPGLDPGNARDGLTYFIPDLFLGGRKAFYGGTRLLDEIDRRCTIGL